MRNLFVDYRSGASSRTGFKYVINAYKPFTAVRLIPYQLSSISTFAVEFGDHDDGAWVATPGQSGFADRGTGGSPGRHPERRYGVGFGGGTHGCSFG